MPPRSRMLLLGPVFGCCRDAQTWNITNFNQYLSIKCHSSPEKQTFIYYRRPITPQHPGNKCIQYFIWITTYKGNTYPGGTGCWPWCLCSWVLYPCEGLYGGCLKYKQLLLENYMIIQEWKQLVYQLYVLLKIYIGTTENKAIIKIDLLLVLRDEVKIRELFPTGFVTCQSWTNYSCPFRALAIHGYCLQKYIT